MRVLLSTTSGAGHFRPMLPFARALQRAGHDLACAAPTEARAMVEREGLRHLPFDGVPGDHPERVALMQQMPSLPAEQARFAFGSTIFGRLNTTYALPGAQAAVEDFAPDLVLHESAEQSVRLAAEVQGVRSVAVTPSLMITAFETAVAAGIADLRTDLGLDPDAAAERLMAGPVLSAFPASFDLPHAAERDVHRYRDPSGPVPRDGRDPGAEVVYVTLGSEAHSLPFFAGLLREAVSGAATAGLPVVVSTGADIGPEVLAGIDGDVRVHAWVDQAEVLARSRVVVCHGGSGSTHAALAAAVPLVVVPLFADQPDNAERVVATGSGCRVDPGPELIGRVGDAVRQLADKRPPGLDQVAADIAALPPADDAVRWLESLAR